MTSLQRNCLTGPHTFIASSFTSTHSPCGSSVETNAIKASVPKLFNCPGSRFPTPSQEWFSAAASRPLDELTTPWDRSLICRKRHRHNKALASSAHSLRTRLSAPAQSKNITHHSPLLQPTAPSALSREAAHSSKSLINTRVSRDRASHALVRVAHACPRLGCFPLHPSSTPWRPSDPHCFLWPPQPTE